MTGRARTVLEQHRLHITHEAVEAGFVGRRSGRVEAQMTARSLLAATLTETQDFLGRAITRVALGDPALELCVAVRALAQQGAAAVADVGGDRHEALIGLVCL